MTVRTKIRSFRLLLVVTLSGLPPGICSAACPVPSALQAKLRGSPGSPIYAELAGWYERAHQFSCAIDALRRAAELDPSSASVQYSLGRNLYAAGRLPDASAALARAVTLDPSAFEARLSYGVVLHETGHKAEALAQWQEALSLDPTSVVALDWIAKARIEAGQYNAAIDLLRTAPQAEELSLDLAVAYAKAGMYDRAIDSLRSAMEQHPNASSLKKALATVLVQSHRFADAVALLNDAKGRSGNDPDTDLLLLRVLVLSGDSTTATPLAKRLLASTPKSFDLLYLNGLLERESGDYESAAHHLEAARLLQPDHYDATYNLGFALARLHRNVEAREMLRKAVALNSSAPEAHFQLAGVLRAMGDSAGAHRELEIYQQQVQQKAAREQAANLSTQAALKLSDGDAASAVSLYRGAQAASPGDGVQFYNLALALARTGDVQGERVALERALQLRPDLAPAQNQLGYLEAQAGELASAEKSFRGAIASSPEYSEAENNLGALLAGQGKERDAEQLFRSAVSSNPRYVDAWINLAATLASTSRFSEAAQAAQRALSLAPDSPDARRLIEMLDRQ